MKYIGCIGLLAVGVLFALPAQAQDYARGHVLVSLHLDDDSDEVEVEHGTTATPCAKSAKIYRLKTPRGKSDSDFVLELRNDLKVRHAELDRIVNLPEMDGKPFHFPIDSSKQQGAFKTQPSLRQANLVNAQQKATGTGVIVAVLDTGVQRGHPALKGKTLRGLNVINPSLPPEDTVDTPNTGAAGHGTMIAGVISLIAPDAKILPIRVLASTGKGTTQNILKGLEYALSKGARVINMSFGSVQSSSVLDDMLDVIADAGVVLVASAGNEDANGVNYPSSHSDVISVGALDDKNLKTNFSNYGKGIVLMAPGLSVRSTYFNNAYANWSGTSFATPFVSATAALVISRFPNMPVDWVEDQLRGSAKRLDKKNPKYKGLLGKGLLDIDAAVEGNH